MTTQPDKNNTKDSTGLSHQSTPHRNKRTKEGSNQRLNRSLTLIILNHPLYRENKQRQKDWTNGVQIKIISYLAKDFIQPRPVKSFNRNLNFNFSKLQIAQVLERKEHISRYASRGGATHYVGLLIPCTSLVVIQLVVTWFVSNMSSTVSNMYVCNMCICYEHMCNAKQNWGASRTYIVV